MTYSHPCKHSVLKDIGSLERALHVVDYQEQPRSEEEILGRVSRLAPVPTLRPCRAKRLTVVVVLSGRYRFAGSNVMVKDSPSCSMGGSAGSAQHCLLMRAARRQRTRRGRMIHVSKRKVFSDEMLDVVCTIIMPSAFHLLRRTSEEHTSSALCR